MANLLTEKLKVGNDVPWACFQELTVKNGEIIQMLDGMGIGKVKTCEPIMI